MTSSIKSAEDMDERAEELLELINQGKTIPSEPDALIDAWWKAWWELIEGAHCLLPSKFYITIIKVMLTF